MTTLPNPPIVPKGIVMRLQMEPLKMLLLKRGEGELFGAEEWVWSEDAEKACVFATYEEAEKQAEKMRADGADHAHAVVCGEWKREQLMPPATGPSCDSHPSSNPSAATKLLAKVNTKGPVTPRISPQECFEINERKHLA